MSEEAQAVTLDARSRRDLFSKIDSPDRSARPPSSSRPWRTGGVFPPPLRRPSRSPPRVPVVVPRPRMRRPSSTSSSRAPAPNKIAVIKVVREITGLGLKEAKAPRRRSAEADQGRRVSKDEAEEIQKKLTEDVGAEVELK